MEKGEEGNGKTTERVKREKNDTCKYQLIILKQKSGFPSDGYLRKGQKIDAQRHQFSSHAIFKFAKRCQRLTKW